MFRNKQSEKVGTLNVFGPVWDSAGSRGFYGEGYWHHKYVPGLSFTGSTFVTKTVTTHPHAGNTPLSEHHSPLARFPDSIKTYPFRKMVLNSVGLSNPGIAAALATERWFSIREPFMISYMPLAEDEAALTAEVREFACQMSEYLRPRAFTTRALGIQVNVSCPNAGVNTSQVTSRAAIILNRLERLALPLVVKLNLEVSPDKAQDIARHPRCSGICIANSIPFGTVLPQSWWDLHFPYGSPLEAKGYGKGGLSGAPLLPLVEQWVRDFRKRNPYTYLNAGGGILKPRDVNALEAAGANSVFIGSAGILRPLHVRKIVERAHALQDA